MPYQTYNCTPYIWTGHKAVRRYICRQIWFCIILNCQGKRAIVLCSRLCLHPQSYFLLHHHRNAFYRHMAFKQPHNNRRCNIIRKICHHLYRPSPVLLADKLPDIQLQHICMDDVCILIFLQCLFQNRKQRLINFYCYNLSRTLRKVLGHRTDSRPYF